MRKRSISNTPFLKEAKKKKRKIFIKRMSVYFFVLVIFFVGLSFLSKWNKLNIENVEISGNKVTDSKTLENMVKKEILGEYLWFFPKSNFLIYPKGKIKQELAGLTILKDINVELKGVKTLSVEVSEREGKYVWCGDSLPLETSLPLKCYFMDESGLIFGEAPYFSGDVYLKFFGKAVIGSKFYESIFSKLANLRESMDKIGIKISYLLVKEDGDVELYISGNIISPDSPKIILKVDSDFGKIIENLDAALATEPLKSDFKNKKSSLQYLDLRFGDKVYFKFK